MKPERRIFRCPIWKTMFFWSELLLLPEFVWMCTELPGPPGAPRFVLFAFAGLFGFILLLLGITAYWIEFADERVILHNAVYPFLSRAYRYDGIKCVEYFRSRFNFLIITCGEKRSWPLHNIDFTYSDDRDTILAEFRSRGIDARAVASTRMGRRNR